MPLGSGAGEEGAGSGDGAAVLDGDGHGDGEEDRPGELAARGERDGRPEPVLLRPGPGLVWCPGPGERAGGPDGAGAGATTPKLEPGPGLGARPPGGRTAIAAAVRTVASPAVTTMIVGGSSRYGCTRNDRAQLRAIALARSSAIAAATPAAVRRGP